MPVDIFGNIKSNNTMILYHYTSINHFRGIWKEKKLYFSPAIKTNDFFERFKTFVMNQDTFKYKGQQLDRNKFDNFDDKIWEELRIYNQVSFSYDYKDGLKGYASPMMWGQYAWTKDQDRNGQNGVCIAIDSDKIKEPSFKFYSKFVSYKPKIVHPIVENIDYTLEEAAALFVERNIDTYFFTKHTHWEHENEYRYVSKHKGSLDISNAIVGIYILFEDNTSSEEIESLVKDNSLIHMLDVDDINNHREPMTLKDIYYLQEMMRTYKF